MQLKESQVQSKIIKALEKSGWLVIKIIQSTKNGIPDLIAHRDGRTIYIEVKRPGGKVRELQGYRIKQLTEQGIEVFIFDDQKQIITHGLN